MVRRLVSVGVTDGMAANAARKVRIANLASLLTVGLFGFFTMVLLLKQLWFHATVYGAFTLVYFLPVYVNSTQRFALARAVMFGLVAFSLFAVELIIRSNSRGIFLVCLMLLGVFLSESRWEAVLIYIGSAVLYMLIKSVPSLMDVTTIRMESDLAFWLNLLFGAGGLATIVELFKTDGRKHADRLAQANTALDSKRSEAEEHRAIAQQQAERMADKNKELKALNIDLLDGIRYAKRIQTSMLLTKEQMQEHLPEVLIFLKPKDVLSGDFYWFAEKDGQLFLAVADCTGHGVPGALMTVMGNNLLHQIVVGDGTHTPSEILQELDRRVTELLRQRTAANDKVTDGMDIAIVRIDRSKGKMLFASAKRPLYAFRGADPGLEEFPASRQSIGDHGTSGKEFAETEIVFSDGDMFYLCSDGFPDQFGPQGKFMPKRFRQLLTEICPKPMAEQHRLLNESLLRWRVREPQTDDVLVLGFRV